jgi:hypothetical protein
MRPVLPGLSLVFLVTTLLPAQQPTAQVRADQQASVDLPFETWTVLLPYRRGVTIWARNADADTVALTRATLSACSNISNACGPKDLDLVLGPGDSAEVMTLRPKVWDDQYSYQVAWEWKFPVDQRPKPSGAGDGAQLPFAVWAQTSEERHEVALMARNTSAVTVIISQVQLSDCENIGITCGAFRLNVRLAPGDSASTIILRPDHWGESFRFHLDWEWTSPTGGQ